MAVEIGVLEFPKKLFQKKFGFGFDFGSSIIKVVYTTEEGDNLKIHLVNFSRHHLEECVNFLKEKCAGKLQPGDECIFTGIGIGANQKYIEEQLNLKCKINNEEEIVVDGLVFMAKHETWEKMFYPANNEIRAKAAITAKSFHGAMGYLDPDRSGIMPWHDALSKIPSDNKVHFPIVLCNIGSGHYIYKIEANGHMEVLDFYTIAGKTFLALGRLLPVADTFSEIIELARNGCATAVDQTLGNLGVSENDTTYNVLNQSTTKLFAFGLAAGDTKKDFRKEDIAAALVSMIANSAAQDAFNWSLIEKVQQVFLIGGVTTSQLFRDELEREFFEKCHTNAKMHASDCLFVRDGGHLTALGCLFSNLGLTTP